MYSAAELPLSQSGKPAPDERRLVSAVIVQDHMYVQPRRNRLIDRIQKLAELHAAVPSMKLPHHPAGSRVQGGKPRGRPMTGIVVGASLHLTRPHGNRGLGPTQALLLAFSSRHQPQ